MYRWGNILHVYLLYVDVSSSSKGCKPAMERVPEIVMVAIVCQSLNPSQKQVHMRYVSPPIHGEWNETLYARSPDPSALFFARRVWLARLTRSPQIPWDLAYAVVTRLSPLPPHLIISTERA